MSSKDILLSVSLPHFSCPDCLEYLCPRALILLRLWRYINHVLTYLLTYLLTRDTVRRTNNSHVSDSDYRIWSSVTLKVCLISAVATCTNSATSKFIANVKQNRKSHLGIIILMIFSDHHSSGVCPTFYVQLIKL